MDFDDILDLDIPDMGDGYNEEAEYAKGSYATANVSNGVSGTKVSVPGGEKESPTAKPYDSKDVPIPGGDKESPNAKPHDQASVSIPGTPTLTDTQWKSMLASLQRSFKEGVEALDILSNVNVVHKTTEQLQMEYVESVIDQALLEAFEDGPIFEAVDRDDKEEVKSIVRKIRDTLKKDVADLGYKYKPCNAVVRGLLSVGGYVAAAAAGAALGDNSIVGGVITTMTAAGTASAAKSTFETFWNNRLWQILGMVYVEEGNVNDVTTKLTEKHSETLGKYKILPVKATSNFKDLLNNKFGWKNVNKTYFLLVDKKITKEFKDALNQIEVGKKEDESPKTESYEYDEYDESYEDDYGYDAYVAEASKYKTYKSTYEQPSGNSGVSVSTGERRTKAGLMDKKEFKQVRKELKEDLGSAYDKYRNNYKEMVKKYGKEATLNALGELKPKHIWVGETIAEWQKRDGRRFTD